ncbi:unnamed protein product [Adineta ricciae]|uniref:DED domain-containing protein n=1 Tax=Adineta ricciae TaxID=249248 RepID=A0A814MUX2_ADIRI|nr:unnamed protein product [Adineta ricciae]CAF1103295.1 unnamed protein product [Adineta ricciae]
MNNQNLRKVLLKVGDRLSDQSRKRLHFLLGDNVTRPIQDDTTIHGTVDLWQSLFDQDKINESDVTLLIDAFRDIGCMDAAKNLQKYMQSVRSTGVVNESTEVQTIQTTSKFDTLIDDQEDVDKVTVNTRLNYQSMMGNDNHLDSKYMAPGEYVKRKLCFGESVGSSKEKKYQLLCISISIVLLAIITIESIWIFWLYIKYDDTHTRNHLLQDINRIAQLNRSLLEKETEMTNLTANVSSWLEHNGIKCTMETVNVSKADKVVISMTVSDEEHEIFAQRNPKIMKD